MYLLTNRAATEFGSTVARFITADGFDSLRFLVTHFADQEGQLWYVVPTGRRARWLFREITRCVFQQTHRPLVGFTTFNLARLAAALHEQLYPDDTAVAVSDSLQLSLIEQAMTELSQQGQLPFYAPHGKPSWGLIERLASVIIGLRKDGITPADLHSELAAEGHPYALDRARLRDIVTLYERYLALLGNSYRDETAYFERVGDAILHDNRSLAAPPIILEGFSDFRLPELRMLSALAITSVPVCIVLAYSRQNGPLFGNLDRVLETLLRLGYSQQSFDPSTHDGTTIWHRPRTAYLRRWLFNTEQDIRNPEFNQCITILGCTNRLEEVTLIAKYVKHCIANLGYRPSQICVAMRDPEHYAGLFRELFAVHGIPANISDRFRLERSPVAVAVMSVLEMIVRGWRREDVHRVLANPLIRCTHTDGTPLDAAVIIEVAERLRISGGHRQGGPNGWLERLERAHEHARQYLAALERQTYPDPLERRQAEQDVAQIERAIADIRRLQELLPSPQLQLTPTEFSDFVRKHILQQLGIAHSIEEAFERSWSIAKRTPEDIMHTELIEQETRAYAAILELLAEIEYAWSISQPQTSRSLAEYVELLATMVRATRYQIAEKPSYGVTITSIEQTRGIPYDVYVLCGMVDGEFPLAYSTDYFLGKELPDSEERHIRAERIQFYEALTNNPQALEQNSWRMLITYPRLTTNGEQLVRSSFVDKLLKVTTLDQCSYSTDELARQRTKTGKLPDMLAWIADITAPEELQRLVAPPYGQIERWECTPDVILDSHACQAIAHALDHPLSAAELEQYAHCPYQYFAQRILKLRTPKTYDLALGSLESGALLHRILSRFYQTLLKLKGETDPVTGICTIRLDPSQREQYMNLLHQCAEEELERFRHTHPIFALESELFIGTADRKGILLDWLEREIARFDSGWEYAPAFFECAFGMSSTHFDTADAPIQLSPTLTIRGKIDRIELAQRGSQWHILVADYKLHRAGATNSSIAKGEAFQMPFYMLAAQQLFRRRYGIDATIDGGIYYVLRPSGDDDAIPIAMPQTANDFAAARGRRSSQVLKSRSDQEALLQTAIAHAERLLRQMQKGIFPVAPQSQTVCQYCSFASVCRIRQLYDDGLMLAIEPVETSSE